MKRVVASALLAVLSVNCASIVHQTTQQVAVTSDPPGANVTVACGDVENDPKLLTPTHVTIHRKTNPCSIAVNKEGYKSQTVEFTRHITPWYWGNILIGGIVGLIVDAANGAMYDKKPKEVTVTLEPAS